MDLEKTIIHTLNWALLTLTSMLIFGMAYLKRSYQSINIDYKQFIIVLYSKLSTTTKHLATSSTNFNFFKNKSILIFLSGLKFLMYYYFSKKNLEPEKNTQKQK
jgi:hypothetical protein